MKEPGNVACAYAATRRVARWLGVDVDTDAVRVAVARLSRSQRLALVRRVWLTEGVLQEFVDASFWRRHTPVWRDTLRFRRLAAEADYEAERACETEEGRLIVALQSAVGA